MGQDCSGPCSCPSCGSEFRGYSSSQEYCPYCTQKAWFKNKILKRLYEIDKTRNWVKLLQDI